MYQRLIDIDGSGAGHGRSRESVPDRIPSTVRVEPAESAVPNGAPSGADVELIPVRDKTGRFTGERTKGTRRGPGAPTGNANAVRRHAAYARRAGRFSPMYAHLEAGHKRRVLPVYQELETLNATEADFRVADGWDRALRGLTTLEAEMEASGAIARDPTTGAWDTTRGAKEWKSFVTAERLALREVNNTLERLRERPVAVPGPDGVLHPVAYVQGDGRKRIGLPEHFSFTLDLSTRGDGNPLRGPVAVELCQDDELLELHAVLSRIRERNASAVRLSETQLEELRAAAEGFTAELDNLVATTAANEAATGRCARCDHGLEI